jgi:hypothetical protein
VTVAKALTRKIWCAIGGDESDLESVSFCGTGELPSTFLVTDLASASVATAGLSILELVGRCNGQTPSVTIDRRLSSLWFGLSLRPIGWNMAPLWDPIAGDYQASDGWIRLHTNAPHHRAAAERILGPQTDKEDMARAIAGWRKGDLEKAVVEAGGCAAEMRTTIEWAEHEQGIAVAAEPLAGISTMESARFPNWRVSSSRPLKGLRVLDLTRVLAGPVASRFLAAYGAEVLRVDPPGWDEPGIVPEVALGKRCARLDLHRADEARVFTALLSQADIILHGLRPGALDRLGFDRLTRRTVSAGLIDVCLDAYGWSGPWARRRGFDSLVQMSTGIANAGMLWRDTDRPTPLPVQALDHATGYLMAAVAIRGVTNRLLKGNGTEARLSLARTAKLLIDEGVGHESIPFVPETAADVSPTAEATEWGSARRLNPPVAIDGAPMLWEFPARSLGSAEPRWW